MELFNSFKKYIQKENLFYSKDHLLVAVSGGVDSIVLCDLCKEAGFDFSIAHCNFQLRNEESDGDEQFVKAFAEKMNVPFFVKRFDTEKYSADNKVSIQVAARELRYAWFDELISGMPVSFLLTAHHADDDVETMLINFFKGTGINGLKGILPKQQKIVRPLLFASKETILTYAKKQELSFREDSSNSSDKYTRNYFRNQLIPALEKVFPQVKENLFDNVHRFKEVNDIYNAAIQKTKDSLLIRVGGEYHISVQKLLRMPALNTVLFEIIGGFNFSPAQSAEVEKLLHAESGKYVLSSTHRILRNRKWLIVSALSAPDNSIFLLEKNIHEITFPAGKINIRQHSAPQKIEPAKNIAQLTAADIRFPLIIRRWKQGDYFYPLGMKKKKKLSRFFIDQKLSLLEKENTWVMESDKRIVWVIGHRIDDRFKITGKTTSVINLSFT